MAMAIACNRDGDRASSVHPICLSVSILELTHDAKNFPLFAEEWIYEHNAVQYKHTCMYMYMYVCLHTCVCVGLTQARSNDTYSGLFSSTAV